MEFLSCKVFPICQQITVSIYFPLHLVYSVICWYLHDVHAIELNQLTWVVKLINWDQAILIQKHHYHKFDKKMMLTSLSNMIVYCARAHAHRKNLEVVAWRTSKLCAPL